MPIAGSNKDAASIIKAAPLAAAPSKVQVVTPIEVAFKPTSVDLRWQAKENLLMHIEGSSWSVKSYFSQVLTTDSDLSGQQLSASGVHQQYIEIRDLELKVTSALNTSQDSVTKAMTVEGTSMVYPYVIPNEGDMFIADIGEGRLALFRLRSTTKKSIFKQACYEITYALDTTDSIKMESLKSKVVQTYYHQKNFLTYGKNPLLVRSEVDALINLEKQYMLIVDYYMKRFFSAEYKTLMVPMQKYPTYDPFLVEFILKTFSVLDHVRIQEIRQLNTMDDSGLKSDSFWKAIQYRNELFMNTCFQEFGLVDTRWFSTDPVYNSLRWSGFAYVIYPKNPILGVDDMQCNSIKELSTLQSFLPKLRPVPTTPAIGDLDMLETYSPSDDDGMNYAYTQDPSPIPEPAEKSLDPKYAAVRAFNLRKEPIHHQASIRAISAEQYVLSDHFYKRDSEMCVFEGMVWEHIENKRADPNQLLDLTKLCWAWGVVEQFYYMPILLTMIGSAIRGA
jgi:hypothetical protein